MERKQHPWLSLRKDGGMSPRENECHTGLYPLSVTTSSSSAIGLRQAGHYSDSLSPLRVQSGETKWCKNPSFITTTSSDRITRHIH